MRIVIEKSGCVGHARCQAVAPEMYSLDEVGYIDSDGFDVLEGQEKLASRGARACPERIIRIVGDPSGVEWPPAAA